MQGVHATGVYCVHWQAMAIQRVSCILLLCPSCTHEANRASFFTLLHDDSAHLLSEVGANFHAVSTCQHLHCGCKCLRRGILGALRFTQQTKPMAGVDGGPGLYSDGFHAGDTHNWCFGFCWSRLRWDAGMQGLHPPICLSWR